MIPIIRDLLDAEKEAERIVGEAREQVQKERTEVESEEQSRLQEARKAASVRIEEELSQARSEEQARFAAAREQAHSAVEEFLAENDDQIERVVRDIVGYVCRREAD